jgi:hypothetical protein
MAHPLGVSWKRNFIKLPPAAERTLTKQAAAGSGVVVAACTKHIPLSAIRAGQYSHLGIGIDSSGAVVFPPQAAPHPLAGKYSERNANGQNITRRDLPKVQKTWHWTFPAFGDWSKPVTASHTKDVYQVEYKAPEEAMINIELLKELAGSDPTYIFKFSIDRSLDPAAPEAASRLLAHINLLQENTGTSGVFPGDAGTSAYLQAAQVAWELIPVGNRDAVLLRLFSKTGKFDDEARRKAIERYDLLNSMRPQNWISGSTGFQRYFGAQFGNNLVVFENLAYGNALYLMKENWQALSRLSRGELIDKHSDKVMRITHTPGWQARLKAAVSEMR